MQKFKVKSGGIPAGTYRAKFVGVEETTHVEYGPVARWEFEVIEGPSAGQKTSRITKQTPTLKNSCGKMLMQLAGGKTLKVDDVIDLTQFIGRTYMVMVEETPSGATRVSTVMPA